MIFNRWKLSLYAVFGLLILNLTACKLSSDVNNNIKLQAIQAYLKNDNLYIDILSNRHLHTSSNELLSRVECMYDENQQNIFSKDLSLKDNEVIIDGSYQDRLLIPEKSTSTNFYYQVKLVGFVKNKVVFHNNTMSCRFMVGKLIGGKKFSNVIQFDMSNLYNN